MWQANETISTRSHFSAAGFGAQGGLEQALLLRVLDEVDYGVLVIDGQGRLRSASAGYTTELGMRLRLWWVRLF